MVARLFATSTRTALKAAKANLALNRGLATAAPAVGKVKYVYFY
jgi:F-type H+-transporting ATPase subunit beta